MKEARLSVWVKWRDSQPFRSEGGARCNFLKLNVTVGRPFSLRAPEDAISLDVGNFGWNMCLVNQRITANTFADEKALKKSVTARLRRRGLQVISWGEEEPEGYRYWFA